MPLARVNVGCIATLCVDRLWEVQEPVSPSMESFFSSSSSWSPKNIAGVMISPKLGRPYNIDVWYDESTGERVFLSGCTGWERPSWDLRKVEDVRSGSSIDGAAVGVGVGSTFAASL